MLMNDIMKCIGTALQLELKGADWSPNDIGRLKEKAYRALQGMDESV